MNLAHNSLKEEEKRSGMASECY